MTEAQRKVLAELRSEGYAVVVWSPEELRGANPSRVQDRSIELGHEVIEGLQ
jgi:hypothetical protein